MDHYTELVVAGIARWGWQFADEIELQLLNAEWERNNFSFSQLPTTLDDREWRAIKRNADTTIVWESKDDCKACGGDGELEARGVDGRYYDCKCPKCYGGGRQSDEGVEIVTTMYGAFVSIVGACNSPADVAK